MDTCYDGKIDKRDIQYFWLILVIAILIILIIIIVMLLNWGEKEKTDGQILSDVCTSAEYGNIVKNENSHILEIHLSAQENNVPILCGEKTTVWTYTVKDEIGLGANTFPGPLILGRLGQTLIIHISNNLSEPITITWHGLDTEANMDGSEISQISITSGETFTYKINLNNPGLFWYHSDINSNLQVQKGLYGVILVTDPEEDQRFYLPKNEKILALSTIPLNENNQIDLKGKNIFLVNGVHNGCIHLYKDTPTRLRIVNCAANEFMRLYLENHDFLKIGGDRGLLEKPLLIKEGKGILLTPGERLDIVFVPRQDKINLYTYLESTNSENCDEKNIKSQNKNYGRDTKDITDEICSDLIYTKSNGIYKECENYGEKVLLVTFITNSPNIEYIPSEKISYDWNTSLNNSRNTSLNISSKSSLEKDVLKIPTEFRKIKKIKTDQCTPVIKINYGQNGDIPYAYKIRSKGVPFQDLLPKQAPIIFENSTYIIEITNNSMKGNNFFLHGFYFQHIETIWKDENITRVHPKFVENKDTIFVPGAKCSSGKCILRLAVKFSSGSKCRNIIAYGKTPTDCRSGGWICGSHILSLADKGQQAFLQIVPEEDRIKYSTYSDNYINKYSKYSMDSDHSYCLTK